MLSLWLVHKIKYRTVISRRLNTFSPAGVCHRWPCSTDSVLWSPPLEMAAFSLTATLLCSDLLMWHWVEDVSSLTPRNTKITSWLSVTVLPSLPPLPIRLFTKASSKPLPFVSSLHSQASWEDFIVLWFLIPCNLASAFIILLNWLFTRDLIVKFGGFFSGLCIVLTSLMYLAFPYCPFFF